MSPTLSRPVVSPNLYALILTSPRLRKALIPDGLLTSPYEVLNYQSTLTLHDTKGTRATFDRTQQIRFLQDGVSAILDHAWGNGILITNYHNSAGSLEDSFKDQGCRHLVIELSRKMSKGQALQFEVERTMMEGFLGGQDWWEINIDHPVHHLEQTIIFPKARPCQKAVLNKGKEQMDLPIVRLTDRRVMVRFIVAKPLADTAYKVRWKW